MPANDNDRLMQANVELTRAVNSMQKSLAEGNPAYAKNVRSLEANRKALIGRNASERSVQGAMESLHDSIGQLGNTFTRDFQNFASPMNMLGNAIHEGIATSMEVQKSALQLGMQVDDVIGKFPGEMSTAIGGFTANLEATMKQTDIGMRDLGKHTSMAAARTEALGGNTEGLISAQRRMETHLGMDAAAVDRSSENMILLSQQYGISTDRLVEGLDALASNFGSFAALGIGEQMTNAVTEFTAQMGAGNEKLVAEFVKSLTDVGGESVQHAVLGGVQDIQHEIMMGNVNSSMLGKAAEMQGARLQGIVSEMQAGGVNMTVALDQLGKLYGKGAVAALQMFQQQRDMTDDQRKQIQITQDWGNTLKILKDEIMTPIKVSLSKHLPPLIEKVKEFLPLFKGILKAVLISAAAVAMKRGLGGMLAGATQAGGPDLMRMAGGAAMLGVGGLGASVGMGAETGGGGLAAAGLATALPLILGTLFGQKKGVKGAIGYGFGGQGGGMFGGAGKLGTRTNPMYVITVGAGGAGGLVGDAMDLFGKKGKLGKVLGKGSGLDRMLSKGASSALKGTAKALGPGVKRLFGKGAAKAFGGFMGKRLAGVAAANMIPVAGQILTVGVLAWEGLQWWKRNQEKRQYKRDQELAEGLADRQKERIEEEISAFNKGMLDSTSYLRVTNEQLRESIRGQLQGQGNSVQGAITRLAGTIDRQTPVLEQTAANTSDMANNKTLDTADE